MIDAHVGKGDALSVKAMLKVNDVRAEIARPIEGAVVQEIAVGAIRFSANVQNHRCCSRVFHEARILPIPLRECGARPVVDGLLKAPLAGRGRNVETHRLFAALQNVVVDGSERA